ncbi:hypothetical protein PILCRDRAFT_307647 [Piloderma croceum F 1598]|uniref:Uncharacterized protein n=1 Tax=Piloderma croceum (strain F 1598) TaxID=765440 RepID=A0A0C3BJK9_PILCF|nr:hypothetical protein PILCRDRAFT_307647 [Piloderma croceum F 1598]
MISSMHRYQVHRPAQLSRPNPDKNQVLLTYLPTHLPTTTRRRRQINTISPDGDKNQICNGLLRYTVCRICASPTIMRPVNRPYDSIRTGYRVHAWPDDHHE